LKTRKNNRKDASDMDDGARGAYLDGGCSVGEEQMHLSRTTSAIVPKTERVLKVCCSLRREG
jgi:hypothetical protein